MTISRTVYHPSDDFLPWVGSSYGESPFKLLVLGESHHHEGDRFPEDKWILFTRGTIEDYLVRSKRWFAGFTRTMAAVAGSDYWLLDRQKFWSDVSFYNFVPGAPVDTPGVSPSQEWFTSDGNGIRLLKELKPDAVFVFGYRLGGHLERLYPECRDQVLSASNGVTVLRIGGAPHFVSKHPSWPYARSWRAKFAAFVASIEKESQLFSGRPRWLKRSS